MGSRKKEKNRKIGKLLCTCVVMFLAVMMIHVPAEAATTLRRVQVKQKAITNRTVTIRWNEVSGETGYVIYRRTSASNHYKSIKFLPANTTTYTDSSVQSAQYYQYAVRAYKKSGGKTVYSKYTPMETMTRPDVPAAEAVALNAGGDVKISWKDVARENGYEIFRKASTAGSWTKIKTVSADTLSYTDLSAPAGKQSYCVRAYKLFGSNQISGAHNTIKSVTVSSSSSKLTASQKEVMKKILYAVETGGQVYGNQDYDDFTEAYTNSSTEYAITIGAGQWYATEAQRLLKLIRTTAPATFKELDTAGVGTDLDTENWSTYKLSKTSAKAKCIQKIISSDVGIQCQDELMYEQIEEYEAEVRAKNVTNARAVGMCINIRHQGGLGAVTRILAKTKAPYTLDSIYTAMQTDTGNQVGTYKTRQAKVKAWLEEYM